MEGTALHFTEDCAIEGESPDPEARRLDEAATKGPWKWRYPFGGVPMLAHPRSGLMIVMDAVRCGMQRATFRFAEPRRTWSDNGSES